MQQSALNQIFKEWRETLHHRLNRRLSHQQQGIFLALISTALFVLTGVFVRILSERFEIFQILLFRQLIFILVLLPAIRGTLSELLKPRLIHLHVLRVSGAFLALYLGYLAVSNIPLADATALGFTQVLFVAVISWWFLGESVGYRRTATILTGFVGVLLVVQPSFLDAGFIYILAGLIGALGAAVAVTCVRIIAQSQSRTVLLVYQAVFVGLMALVPSLYLWQWPGLSDWWLLIAVGLLSSIAQWIGITAYKLAEANVVANVEYSKMVYSVVLGYWLFGEAPGVAASIGVVVIISSAFLPSIFGFQAPTASKPG